MKIAIIGSGISGLTCAYLLYKKHNITIYESNNYVGGHTNTISINDDNKDYNIDTGFIVYNNDTYPNFVKILNKLKVETQPSTMSFSLTCQQSGLEYGTGSLSSLFGNKSNIINLKFYKLLFGIITYFKNAKIFLNDNNNFSYTVLDFIKESKTNIFTYEKFILPMASAIWSTNFNEIEQMPAKYLFEFYKNHDLLSINPTKKWRVIKGGSKQYVSKLTKPFYDKIRLNTNVLSIQRKNDAVFIKTDSNEQEKFDSVIIACHSDQALKILKDLTSEEKKILSNIPYQSNQAILHTDISVLPKNKKMWSSWNSFIPKEEESKVSLTYNMNILQSLKSEKTFCVSINMEKYINPSKVIKKINYSHPTFNKMSVEAQSKKNKISGKNNTYFAGAYWRYGFHEDGVMSALEVCKNFGVKI
tara:strand:+ start:62671 stop:63918 length:1248 start_codon:yes stop_codon:yes gene_type:complete